MNHRNRMVGKIELVNISNQFWHVKYNGQVLYSDTFRHRALKKAEMFNRELSRIESMDSLELGIKRSLANFQATK